MSAGQDDADEAVVAQAWLDRDAKRPIKPTLSQFAMLVDELREYASRYGERELDKAYRAAKGLKAKGGQRPAGTDARWRDLLDEYDSALSTAPHLNPNSYAKMRLAETEDDGWEAPGGKYLKALRQALEWRRQSETIAAYYDGDTGENVL